MYFPHPKLYNPEMDNPGFANGLYSQPPLNNLYLAPNNY